MCSSVSQQLKQDLEISPTHEGTQMDFKDEHSANADSSRRDSLEPASNDNSESFEQLGKHESEMTATDDGMQIV
jgi:hypothetical protein